MQNRESIELLEEIRGDLESDNVTPIELSEQSLNSAMRTITTRDDEEYNRRNAFYSELLSEYIKIYKKKEDAKAKYKSCFFVCILVSFFIIVVGGIAGIILISIFADSSLASAGIAAVDVAGIISALMVLPKIIAEHLFPVDEESNMLNMVQRMQENDTQIRNMLYDIDNGDDN